jgi:SPP1 gp7 family putative phage head morphogenesis protein
MKTLKILQNKTDYNLKKLSLPRLQICRDIIANILGNFKRNESIKKQIGEFGIFIGKGKDDTGKREIQIFRTLRNTMAAQVARNVKTGPAVTKLIKNYKIVDGVPSIDQKDVNAFNKAMSKVLGADVAKKTFKNIDTIVKNQWLATKSVMASNLKKLGREIKRGITTADRAVVNVLSNNNNFFVGQTYDREVVENVNRVIATNVEKGLPKRGLNIALRREISEQVGINSDVYYKILSNDVLNRARTFAQVNSYVEAKVKRYEFLAVIDERTSAICEYYDGRIFEVETARRIIRDITKFGVPETDRQVDKFKSLRPWVLLDRDRAREGKNALFYTDPRGKKVFLPNSTMAVNADGSFRSTGSKSQKTTRQIVQQAPRGGNPPVIPPLHGNCRSTTVVTEELITE